MATRITANRLLLTGLSLICVLIPACLQPPPTPQTPPPPLAKPVRQEPVTTLPEVTISRRSEPPALRHIELRPVAAAMPENARRDIVPVKAEQANAPARVAPATLDLAVTELPVIETAPVAKAPVSQGDATVVEALRHYQAGAPARASQALQALTPNQRDTLALLLPIAARMSGEQLSATPDDLAAVVAQMEKAVAELKSKATLQIAKLSFCRPVQAPARFGVFEPLDEHHRFKPGEVVAVYVELRNFSCDLQNGNYRSCVANSVEILDAEGHVAGRFDFETTDASQSPRSDYCHIGRFPLPKMPGGAYTLRLTVTDRPTGRTARGSLDLQVAAVEAAGK